MLRGETRCDHGVRALEISETREKRDFCPTAVLTLLLWKNNAGQSRQLHIKGFIEVNSSGAISQGVGAAGGRSWCYQEYEDRLWVCAIPQRPEAVLVQLEM